MDKVRISKEILQDVKDVTQKVNEFYEVLMNVVVKTANFVEENDISFENIHEDDLKIIEDFEKAIDMLTSIY